MSERRDNTIIVETIKKTIEETVNGKIIDLHKKIDDYINTSMDWRIKIDQALDELKPVNTGVKWFQNTKAGATYIAGLLTPIAIIIGILSAVIHFIRGT
jgi:hypothetical protein